mmetsp:Transcript_22959/g.22299  ORF Transcript_22959/g.22299 Transcript_22959/m.22299 type:complete len:112 (+) Transcript_22959:34-369(+)
MTRICGVFLALALTLQVSLTASSGVDIHVIPHSVVPTGWKETHVQYYWDYVRDTLNSVVRHLNTHDHATFVWSNLHYFSMWWNVQDDIVKDIVRTLVEEERLQFVDGGWVD